LRLIKGVKGPLRKLKGGKVGLKVNYPTGPYTQAQLKHQIFSAILFPVA
jgi:hypothetical protein